MAAKELVNRLSEDAYLLIAIRQMSERFSFDERIDSVFNNVYQAHGFKLVQSSIEYVLVLALMRIHDTSERSDVYSLSNLFDELLPDTADANNFGDKATLFEDARTQFKELKESHLLARTKMFRDKFIAHAGILSGNEQMPKNEYLGQFTDKTISLIEKLSIIVLDASQDYNFEDDKWKKYASSFFDALIQGQLTSNNKLG